MSQKTWEADINDKVQYFIKKCRYINIGVNSTAKGNSIVQYKTGQCEALLGNRKFAEL